MFIMDQKTRISTTGLKNSARSKVMAACITALLSSGVAYSHDFNQNIQAIHSQLSHRENVLISNVSNQIEANNSNNTVLLVMRSLDGTYLNWGSGVVIKDSGNNTNPHNRILTSWTSAQPQLFAKLEGRNEVPPFGNVYIFNAQGNILGTGIMIAHGLESDIIGNKEQEASANLAVLSVTPEGTDYDRIEGASLARNIPVNIFNVSSNKGIIAGPGLSGSPAFDASGRVLGIGVSYSFVNTAENLVPVYKAMSETDKIILPEDQLGNPVISQKEARGNLVNEVPIHSNITIAPINSSILNALNSASYGVTISNNIPSQATIMGYTNQIGFVKKENTIRNEH